MRRAHRQVATRALGHQFDRQLRPVNLGKDRPRMHDQRLAEGGRHKPLGLALEQGYAKITFEFSQPFGQGRLRHAEPVSRMAHMGRAVQLHQHVQLTDAQALSPFHDSGSMKFGTWRWADFSFYVYRPTDNNALVGTRIAAFVIHREGRPENTPRLAPEQRVVRAGAANHPFASCPAAYSVR
ncbi:hypothetical protein GCM10027081_08590 [Cupriavidus yeoncheonensis]|nr:hypothetical protein [Cupriavidus yeoncheonensis]